MDVDAGIIDLGILIMAQHASLMVFYLLQIECTSNFRSQEEMYILRNGLIQSVRKAPELPENVLF